jgi:hypothetical protein
VSAHIPTEAHQRGGSQALHPVQQPLSMPLESPAAPVGGTGRWPRA